MAELEYTRPFLYSKQEKAIFSSKRWSLCEASTKSGKTVASIARIIEWGLVGNGMTAAAPGQNYWWVAPVSDQARIAFARVKLGMPAGTFVARESPAMAIHLPTGTTLGFKSADNPDSLYGEDVYGMIIDEASRARAEAWHACRSTLTATRGPAVCIGNVKGRKNWFFEWCRRAEAGLDPNASFMRITWEDAVAAGVLDIEEIEDARRNLPEHVFRELYEAVASGDGGNPFGEDHILACLRAGLSTKKPVAFGVDLAKKQDYLVVLGLDEDGAVCVLHRWNGLPWPKATAEIHRIIGEDTPALVDSTGIGDPVLDVLKVEHGNFHGFHFSPASKQKLMEGLAVSIQNHDITFPDGPVKNELLTFEYAIGPTGNVRYSAPEGYNDDCVVALALARQQWAAVQPGANLMSYYASEAQRAKAEEDRRQLAEDFPDEAVGREFVEALISREERNFNELTELYNSTLAQYSAASKVCRRCGEGVLGNRVSDGVHVWHPHCAG